MTQVVFLSIKNYRGLHSLQISFEYDQNVVCLIGRGDSGKTTILDAIAALFSPRWNLSFYDTDFHNCDTSNPIEITAKIVNFPKILLSDFKYGLHAESYKTECDNPESEIQSLTIKLTVNSALEPRWTVTSKREQDDVDISATDRGKLNCFMISDYVDQHFSWNKGNPLFSLQKYLQIDPEPDDNVIIDALREAKSKIDEADFESLANATSFVEQHAKAMGLNLEGARTTLDPKDLNIRDGRVSLHDGMIPFRNKGKGTKRLASLAIQSALAASTENKGIVLVDELEQGLEPDRIKHLARYLTTEDLGQLFLTTHSRDAIQEFGSAPIVHLIKNPETNAVETKTFDKTDVELQKAVRACPEAFFAEKVIVCEGATEVGICRALDAWRIRNNHPSMAFMDCAYIDGTGNSMASRVTEIHKVGIQTGLFCDSDDRAINDEKACWIDDGVKVFDCEDDLCIEQQIFKDLPWAAVLDLYDYALDVHKKGDVTALNMSIGSRMPANALPVDWRDTDCSDVRKALAKTAKDKEWFKRLGHGEELGKIIFTNFDDITEKARLKISLLKLNSWIDGEV